MSDDQAPRIYITRNGPYVVKGRIPIVRETIVVDGDGESAEWERGEVYAEKDSCSLCRCGQSARKPFCDGSHMDAAFDGTETASRAPYEEQAVEIPGPKLSLHDVKSLCAEARFCHREGGIWHSIEHTDDAEVADRVRTQTANCPSGRYVTLDTATGRPIEPELGASIGLIRDPHADVSGPLWVRGGMPVESADGSEYERRNRMTLCRCGRSSNKPFCDGSHVECHFNEEH